MTPDDPALELPTRDEYTSTQPDNLSPATRKWCPPSKKKSAKIASNGVDGNSGVAAGSDACEGGVFATDCAAATKAFDVICDARPVYHAPGTILHASYPLVSRMEHLKCSETEGGWEHNAVIIPNHITLNVKRVPNVPVRR